MIAGALLLSIFPNGPSGFSLRHRVWKIHYFCSYWMKLVTEGQASNTVGWDDVDGFSFFLVPGRKAMQRDCHLRSRTYCLFCISPCWFGGSLEHSMVPFGLCCFPPCSWGEAHCTKIVFLGLSCQHPGFKSSWALPLLLSMMNDYRIFGNHKLIRSRKSNTRICVYYPSVGVFLPLFLLDSYITVIYNFPVPCVVCACFKVG